MSELLKDVMNERAGAAHIPDLDVASIIATGDRRIRRRRVAVGMAAVSAVVAAAVAVPAVVDHDSAGRRTPPATKGSFETHTTTYALGTTIYYGDDAIDVSPHTVTAMVQTDYGFVFTAQKGAHQGVFWTNAERTRQIGETNQQAGTVLAADDAGPYVEWVDTDARPLPEFVVFDTRTAKEVVRTSEGNKATADQQDEFDLPVVHAIDDGTAYWHSSAGTVAYDIDDQSQQLLRANTSPSYLFDVANGVFAHATHDDLATAVTTDITADNPFVRGIGEPVLSPSGTAVTTTPGRSSEVFDVATGDDVTPRAAGFSTILLTQWADDHAFIAIGTRRANLYRGDVSMLLCTIEDRQCTVENESIGSLDELVFPVGGSLTDR